MTPLPEAGVNFPSVGGRRPSTETGKRICADAVRGLDPGLADRIEDDRIEIERIALRGSKA